MSSQAELLNAPVPASDLPTDHQTLDAEGPDNVSASTSDLKTMGLTDSLDDEVGGEELSRDLDLDATLECDVAVDSVESLVRLINESLDLHDERAWFLEAMFDMTYYQTQYDVEAEGRHALLSHYLAVGMKANHSPSPVFDVEFTRHKLGDLLERDITEDENVMQLWLKVGFASITATAFFEEGHYLQQYPDLRGAIRSGYHHYATHGYRENRLPSQQLARLANLAIMNFDVEAIDLQSMIRAVPPNRSQQFCGALTHGILKKLFMPALYRAQCKLPNHISDDALFAHFLTIGLTQAHRPSVLFHEVHYRDQLILLKEKASAQFGRTISLYETDYTNIPEELLIVGQANAYLHWFLVGQHLDVVPTPLFNSEHYRGAHQDIRQSWKGFPFMHFAENGIAEPFRKMSVFFDSGSYCRQVESLQHNSALLDYVMRGQFDNVQPTNGLSLDRFHSDQPYLSSIVEEAALLLLKKMSRLETGALAGMVARATALEPQLVRPYGVRHVRMAPLFHPEVPLLLEVRSIVDALPATQYDNIVLIPHCRMAGSARIAGRFTQALAKLTATGKVLVIHTDVSTFDRPDWFPDDVDVFDLSKHLVGVPQERKIRALLDVVRGLRAKRLVNVNSNLGWHLTNTFGRQLSQWMDIYFYLFCWDLDYKGNKGGYPIQWFLPTFDYCKGVFTDSDILRDELIGRYCLSKRQKARIVTLHTPAEETDVEYRTALESRISGSGTRRVFWSGRFDRQKRVDILLDVARQLPDVEFWVWGKAVIGDMEFNTNNLPSNMKLMGAYQNVDDVPIASCDLFLYTAGWDGLPTVLIEVGSRNVPIVASAVGGVVDLITEDTGWPVDDHENANDYVQAINDVLHDYPAALDKASRLRQHTLDTCSAELYEQRVRDLMQLDDDVPEKIAVLPHVQEA